MIMSFFGDLSFEDFCATCFSELKEFCAKESKTLHMTQLSRPLLGFGRSSDYPTAILFWNSNINCFFVMFAGFGILIQGLPTHGFKMFQNSCAEGMVQGG